MLTQALRASPRVASRTEAASRRAATTSASPAAGSRTRLASTRRAPQPLAATKQSGSEATQRYSYGVVDVEMPLAAVQQLPEAAQAAVVASIFAALGLGTWATCTFVGPTVSYVAPGFFEFSRATWPLLGATFVAAGVAHFTAHDSFCTMMPKQGAWGFWYLPGSASFHVNWTGVAEIAGGAGVLLGALPPVASALPALGPSAAFGLYLLTWAVTPANVYMFTHNAPGPGPAGAVIPAAGHAARFGLQIFLLSILWGLAHPQ